MACNSCSYHPGAYRRRRECFIVMCIAMELLFLGESVGPTTRKSAPGKPALRRSWPPSNAEDLLHRLPAVKTIQSSDGDIIDCVPIHKQIAFNHPKLKQHKLQKQPSQEAVQKIVWEEGGSNRVWQQWRQNGSCPSKTIPVRRTTSEDIARAGSVELYGRKFYMKPLVPSSLLERPQPTSGGGHEHAIAYANNDQYYGSQAVINVWKPSVDVSSEFSLSQMWLLAGSFNEDLNSIEAGWQVSPELYGDSNPRLFTYWTSDAYQETGCYNLLCSGFIQLSNNIAIGASIAPISVRGGSQYDIQILVWKDPQTGNWWMRYGGDSLVGYWPAELFSHLTGPATMVQWGGEIVNSRPSGQHTTTQMGSGAFPQKGFSQASYFRNLGYVDANNQLISTINLNTVAEYPNCYSIQLSNDNDWGDYFYYGGPGHNPNCP